MGLCISLSSCIPGIDIESIEKIKYISPYGDSYWFHICHGKNEKMEKFSLIEYSDIQHFSRILKDIVHFYTLSIYGKNINTKENIILKFNQLISGFGAGIINHSKVSVFEWENKILFELEISYCICRYGYTGFIGKSNFQYYYNL